MKKLVLGLSLAVLLAAGVAKVHAQISPTAMMASRASIASSLSLGAQGDSVTVLQDVLINRGYLKAATATGYYGNMTAAAVSAFQADNNLPTVGAVGPKTLALLNAQIKAAVMEQPAPAQAPATPTSAPTEQPRFPIQLPVVQMPAPAQAPIPSVVSNPSQSCDINVAANTNTCSGVAQVSVVSQQSQQSLIKVTLDPKTNSADTKVRFDVTFAKDSNPDGWNVDIGDSSSNDGYAGDGNTQSNDAETQILSDKAGGYYNFDVFGNDNTPVGDTNNGTIGSRTLRTLLHNSSLAGKTISFVVGDQYLKYDLSSTTPGAIAEMKTSDLYALGGESDFQGTTNYDLYAGFNRVVAGTYRSGTGVVMVHLTIMGANQAVPAVQAAGPISNGGSVAGCFPGNMYSSTTGQPCAPITTGIPGCFGGALFSSMTGQSCRPVSATTGVHI